MSTPPPPPPPGYGGPPPPPGYPQYQYGGQPPASREYPGATAVLVLGILSLVVCGPILGPIAWIKGNSALRDIDAAPGYYTNRGTVQAGRICGMIATILTILAIAFYAVIIVIAIAAGSSN